MAVASPPRVHQGTTSVSAIVSNFNGARFLPRLLESLRRQRGVSVDIIVVDRQSTDDSAAILRQHADVRVVPETPATGLAAGYHAGSLHAQTDLLFFCNEDMWFDDDCLRLLADAIDLSKGVASSDPWQWSYDGARWHHGGSRFETTAWAINSPHPHRAVRFTFDQPMGALVPFPCAGAMMIHRDVYREVGGWDRSFFLDHEDVDLAIRTWQRGWTAVMVPEARVYHAVNASDGQTITAAAIPVSRRRYVAQRANLSVIALKYFSWGALPLAALVWPAAVLNNIRRGQWRHVWGDVQVAMELVRRFPDAWRFRRANARWNTLRPGERFFTAPEHQAP